MAKKSRALEQRPMSFLLWDESSILIWSRWFEGHDPLNMLYKMNDADFRVAKVRDNGL